MNRIAGKFTVVNAGVIRAGYSDPIRVAIKNGEYYYPPHCHTFCKPFHNSERTWCFIYSRRKKEDFYDVLTDYYAAEDLKGSLIHFLQENCITVTKEYPLHEKLVMLRQQQEYSRTYAAERLGIPEEDLSAYERGDKVPNESTIKLIEAFYGRPL